MTRLRLPWSDRADAWMDRHPNIHIAADLTALLLIASFFLLVLLALSP